ncbi:uncharacterized protein BDZ99DRAFT_470545 [Mytilinidion resinicola]|uniref:Uncharacterized protein n=1 Tax=Mytilinidion resinicola TaxID=574789 RepID=A0A6A6ZBF7_9PEZI|nr:uncharacterized protein BDZ99DRAFT_470545 [Mytilinidion resinicola]KAF2817557.1 hypothetical protein BDZ99DRAFT_470545 [Mytilinidion resinicola]
MVPETDSCYTFTVLDGETTIVPVIDTMDNGPYTKLSYICGAPIPRGDDREVDDGRVHMRLSKLSIVITIDLTILLFYVCGNVPLRPKALYSFLLIQTNIVEVQATSGYLPLPGYICRMGGALGRKTAVGDSKLNASGLMKDTTCDTFRENFAILMLQGK